MQLFINLIFFSSLHKSKQTEYSSVKTRLDLDFLTKFNTNSITDKILNSFFFSILLLCCIQGEIYAHQQQARMMSVKLKNM